MSQNWGTPKIVVFLLVSLEANLEGPSKVTHSFGSAKYVGKLGMSKRPKASWTVFLTGDVGSHLDFSSLQG